MSFSQQILLGLTAGVLTGLFFGESAAVLDSLADGFVGLLQMTVLPYVTISIITSLGQLDLQQAKALAVRVGTVLLGLWVVVLGVIFLVPLAFPAVDNASFFSTSLVERRPPFDFVALYVPSNPFNSLANNVVPAVVLFSMVLGIALIGLDRRKVLLDVLQVAGDALAAATRFIAKLTPIGLFAITATAAGTLHVEELGRLQIYLVSYAAVALLLSLWVLPGLVALLTPVPMGAMARDLRNALVTGFAAGNLFIVLPPLVEGCKSLLTKHGVTEGADLPDVLVPATFNFPHSGKLLAISFVLFAGWFSDAIIGVADYPQLGAAGLVALFGSANAAVPFLLNMFQLPADTFQLFLATGVVTGRFGVLVAAMHIVAVSLIGSCAMSGAIRWQPARAVRYGVISVTLLVLTLGGARLLFSTALAPEYHKDKVLAGMNLLDPALRESPPQVATAATPAAPAGSLLDDIRARRTLRVGHFSDSLPFAFTNAQGDLVGFDIELAHRLARELGVALELVPVTRESMVAALDANGSCDLLMSGIAITTTRAADLLFSASYLDETLALLVRDHDRDAYRSWAAVNAMGAIRIGAPDVPYFLEKLHQLAPRAQLQPVPSIEALIGGGRLDLNAFAMPAERGSAWTLLHPQFSIVVPDGTLVKIPLAYPVARRDEVFVSFLNTWIELKRKDGTLDTLFKHWVLGQTAAPRQPRWSILRDVLHWNE